MVTGSQLRTIANARLRAAKILIKAEDWDYAGYTLGFVMECALKAVICKKLDLKVYPADDSSLQKEIKTVFRTHDFDRLLMLAGLSNKFVNVPQNSYFANWSAATQDYLLPGSQEWVNMRYMQNHWTKSKVLAVFRALTDKQSGILVYLKKRW